MKKLCLLILLMAFACLGFSLINEYGYTSGTETYTEITGGTVIYTGTEDDGLTSVTLPFTFTFNSTPMTTVNFSANGWLGMSSFFGNYTPISYGDTPGAIAVLAGDLQGNTNGEMRWETIGTSPNRQIVFQWKNWSKYGYSSYPTQNWGFQVILTETNNYIKMKYNNFNPTTYVGGVQVGIVGATNADYLNRTTTSNWAATTAGTINTDTCSLSSTIYPANGLYFQYTPPLANVVPNPAIIVSPANAATGVSNFATLNWASGGGLPTSYDVYFGTNSTPPLIGNQSVTTYTPAPMTYLQTYYWKIVPRNAIGLAVGCPTWSFTVMADPTVTIFPYNYGFEGTPYPAGGWTLTPDTDGNNILQMATMSNPTASPHGGSYLGYYNAWSLGGSAWLATPPLSCTGGNGYMYTVSFWMYRDPGYAGYDEGYRIYSNTSPSLTGATLLGTVHRGIDMSPTVPSAGWYNYTFNIGDGTIGTRYAIFNVYGVYGNNIAIDDISIAKVPLGGPPNAAVLLSPSSGATGVSNMPVLSWTDGGGFPTGYDVYFGTTLPETPNSPNQAGTTYVPGTLAYNTTYQWKIVPRNGHGPATGCPTWTFTTGGPAINMSNGSLTVPENTVYSFFDSGGPSAPYLNNENYTFTFNPQPGHWIIANFTAYDTEAGCDFLKIYNGANTSAPQIGPASGYNGLNALLGEVVATGPLTFVFISDSSVTPVGWTATVANNVVMTGPPAAVTLLTPIDGATGVNPLGLNLTWTPATTGGTPTYYSIFVGENPIDPANDYYGEFYYETLAPASSFNLAAQPDITLAYGSRWYWSVQANTATESSPIPTSFGFQIMNDPSITVIPYEMPFEVWPPAGWNLAGGSYTFTQFTDTNANNWARANYWGISAGGTGYMTTPLFNSPDALTLQFTWSHLYSSSYPTDALTVQISTDGVNWDNIWYLGGTDFNSNDGAGYTNPGTGVNAMISIPETYTGTPYQLRFYGYSGYGPDLFIDNMSLGVITIDLIPPTISHFPLINTPINNAPYVVNASITDDTVWNSGISAANLYYSVNGGGVTTVPMTTGDGVVYTAEIPAQAYGSSVMYHIEAYDNSPQLNHTIGANHTFAVDSPVWLQYDGGAATNGWGLDAAYGVGNVYINPFGTGALQINSITAGLWNAGTGTIHIYDMSLNDLITPIPYTFVAGLGTVETIPINATISVSAFMVAMMDLATGNWVPMDETATDFPGVCYFESAGAWNTVQDYAINGAWLLRANVQQGSALAAPVVTLSNPSGTDIELMISPVAGATSYNIYASNDPYAAVWTAIVLNTDSLIHLFTGADAFKFYQVTATDQAPVGPVMRHSVNTDFRHNLSGNVHATAITLPKSTGLRK